MNNIEENTFKCMEQSLRTLTVLFKKYQKELRIAIDKHEYRNGIWYRPAKAILRVMTSIHTLLTSNINQLRLKSTPLQLVSVGARLAAIKEGFVYVEARLDELKTNELEIVLTRLKWREARHDLLSSIYAGRNLTELYEMLDIHDLTTGLVHIPKTSPTNALVESQDWPEQLRDIETGTICPICHLDLTEDPCDESQYTFEIVPSTCCKQPFHSFCLTSYLGLLDDRAACPFCRESWDDEEVVGVLAQRIAQMEDMEKGWKSRMSR